MKNNFGFYTICTKNYESHPFEGRLPYSDKQKQPSHIAKAVF